MRYRCIAVLLVMLGWSAEMACASGKVPQFDHIVLVILENHSYQEIIDAKQAPFIYCLASGGALFVNAVAVTHPSQPNYFVLFSGSTQGVRDDDDYSFAAPNLASVLATAGHSFAGYAETGSPRKHNPWESFTTAGRVGMRMRDFPADFARLPTISFVIPNLNHDMHDGSVSDGDSWLRGRLEAYAQWAKTHNSLLIVTFDESDDSADNHIPVIMYGAHVRPGQYAQRVSHYDVLSTLLATRALLPLARTASAAPIDYIWDPSE